MRKLKNITVSDTFASSEIIGVLKGYPEDTPIVAKFGNRNLLIAGYKVINGKPILILR